MEEEEVRCRWRSLLCSGEEHSSRIWRIMGLVLWIFGVSFCVSCWSYRASMVWPKCCFRIRVSVQCVPQAAVPKLLSPSCFRNHPPYSAILHIRKHFAHLPLPVPQACTPKIQPITSRLKAGPYLHDKPHKANPVPSPVQRYSERTSRRRSCCSPKSSDTRPFTCARAERMTLRKFLCGYC